MLSQCPRRPHKADVEHVHHLPQAAEVCFETEVRTYPQASLARARPIVLLCS